ncbi:MAG: hypothetical protein RL338_1849 [Chloroflexota bacterium]
MTARISLALALHNHQPVGNFGWVFGEVYEVAYRPMLEALERHPSVRLSLHYTGALLEWLAAERPDFLDRLGGLVREGRIELLGGGLYEPILASLPERDRVGQLRRMADELERLTGVRPRGAWLAERVWEPSLPGALADAGYRWTILDDAHFRAASIEEAGLWGAYVTEDQGKPLTVFGTGQGLRYRIPFGSVDDVISYLRDHATEAGDRIGVMGDDGEKFGAWPTTWEHCWGSGRWVERFFAALEENAAWLATVTPSGWLDAHPPIGRVYLPTGSYAEMGEWALPAEEGAAFGRLVHDAVDAGRSEARYLRGGFWRNFQVKYREVNDLHKQMLAASAKVDAMAPGRDRERALDHLHRGQSNDCYWHGLFGGIYIAHMRLATHEHLIAAEDLADAAARATGGDPDAAALVDLDLDGVAEARLATEGQVVGVDLAEGAGIGRWDLRAPRHALAAVMRRRPEAYHEALVRHEAELERRAAGGDGAGDGGGGGDGAAEHGGAAGDGAGGGVASIHDLVTTREPGLARLLAYDAHERRSGLVRFLAPDATPAAFARAEATELGDFVDGPFELGELGTGRLVASRDGSVAAGGRLLPVRVTKTLTIGGGRLDPTLQLEVAVENRGDAPLEARLGIEWDLMFLGGGGNPAAFHLIAGERLAHDSRGERTGLAEVAAGNDYVGAAVAMALEPAADAWWFPIETISNSEAGFERVYQGSCTLVSWPLSLPPGGRHRVAVRAAVTATRDRAAEGRDGA